MTIIPNVSASQKDSTPILQMGRWMGKWMNGRERL
jgi:hypothetical protein